MAVESRTGRFRKRKGKVHPNSPAARRDGEAWRFPVPPSQAGPKQVFVTCHYCGYSPPEVPDGGKCPKCGSYSWERFALSRKLLAKGRRRKRK